MRFIHLTSAGSMRRVSIAVNKIVTVSEGDEKGSYVCIDSGFSHIVTEDYSTVLRLINNAHNESDVDHL